MQGIHEPREFTEDEPVTSSVNHSDGEHTAPMPTKGYDTRGFVSFLFFGWVRSWVNFINDNYATTENQHPLPKADEISYWQPIFSRHISDGLLRLEASVSENENPKSKEKRPKPYRSILFRALLITFWRRILFTICIIFVMATTSVGTIVLLKKLIGLLSQANQPLGTIALAIGGIVALEIVQTFIEQHMNLYSQRLQNLMEACIALTLFQHGMCHRRDYENIISMQGTREACNRIFHSWEEEDGGCSNNPLFCPAKRHQNEELPPMIYTFLFVDAYYVVALMDATVMLIRFLCTLTLGMIIMSSQIGINPLLPLMTVLGVILTMVLVECINWYNIHHALHSKDQRISRSMNILGSLDIVKVVKQEDIAYNMIQNCRGDELKVLLNRSVLFSLNRTLMRVVGSIVYLVIMNDYMRNIERSYKDSSPDVAAPITLLYIVSTFVGCFDHLIKCLKLMVDAAASTRRIEKFLRKCSPNYYLKYHKKKTIGEENEDAAPLKESVGFDIDTLVQFKKASFTWINNRRDLVDVKKDKTPMFTGLDFELKRGDFKIITGSQGCGKTSFIKSILGEMSLVSGSMAVAPLSTGMPIFYTSQEIWLPADNIRSIITFGYAYNEEVYNEVVRCAELVTDFSAWEDGDLRVISDKGYSLSGGQRVRISLARALYAYMIFSKANETMENNRCCFLMCLDEPFNGLDVSVATAIFNNLFNKDTGLLVRDDIAVVMAMSKMSMDICSDVFYGYDITSMIIHELVDGNIVDRLANSINDTVAPSILSNQNHNAVSKDSEMFHSSLVKMDKSIIPISAKPESRNDFLKHDHENVCHVKSFSQKDIEEQNRKCRTSASYLTYALAAGWVYSLGIFIVSTAGIAMDKLLGLKVADWTQFISSLSLKDTNLSDTMQKHREYTDSMQAFVYAFIGLIFASMLMAAFATIRASHKIHKFVMDSLFRNALKGMIRSLKEAFSETMTFLSSDMYYIDEHIGRFMVSTLLSMQNVCLQLVIIFITEPFLSPVYVICIVILYVFFLRKYFLASKKLQWVMLDANQSINTVYGNVISGSDTYRSFAKEELCMENVNKHTESFYKVKFIKIAVIGWAMLTCKLFNNGALLLVSCIQISYSYIAGRELNASRIGLMVSYSVTINSMLTSLIYNFSSLDKQMCSMVRFRNYFLQGKFHLKEKFDSMNESILSIFGSQEERDKVDKKRVGDLVKRRKVEFRNFMFRRYRSLLSTLFYKPKIDVLDISAYLPADHTTLSLDNVCVPQPNQTNQDGARYILSDVSAKAFAGDVIGIVGRTGAGKSTLLSVLQNISRRREGSVLLDGRELNDIPRSILRHIIGVLPQIPFVFKGWTLRRFLDPRMLYTDEEIHNALECCGLLELVKSLPDGKGLDAVLTPEDVTVQSGLYLVTPLIRIKKPHDDNVIVRQDIENGNNSHIPETCFSMGQLRMLSFARLVLYRDNYRILLIDEPPSDNIVSNEQAKEPNDVTNKEPDDGILPIYNLVKIYFKHCTTFIVAHDMKALRSCNTVWIMNNGIITEMCSLTDYMSRGLRTDVLT